MPHACLTHVAVSEHRTTATPTCKKDLAIGATQALANAVCVDHSYTFSLRTVNPATSPEPPEGTMPAFTPSWKD